MGWESEVAVPEGAKLIDLSECTVLPGMYLIRIHLCERAREQRIESMLWNDTCSYQADQHPDFSKALSTVTRIHSAPASTTK